MRHALLYVRSAEKGDVGREDRVSQAASLKAPEKIIAGNHLFEEPVFQTESTHEAVFADRTLAGENRGVRNRALDGPMLGPARDVGFNENSRQRSIRERRDAGRRATRK